MKDDFQRLSNVERIVGRARVENTSSIRIFDKLEMQNVEDLVEDGENWVLYEVVRG